MLDRLGGLPQRGESPRCVKPRLTRIDRVERVTKAPQARRLRMLASLPAPDSQRRYLDQLSELLLGEVSVAAELAEAGGETIGFRSVSDLAGLTASREADPRSPQHGRP
jgi:hypothetical protein